ncbi:MAG TPA: DUF2442 domain-containing protein [Bryobacteraceae bacterium]|nr:DUF2442 domain-containing protein [Bryobacteraceae bacterium]
MLAQIATNVIALDGNPVPVPAAVEVLMLGPGERIDAWVTMNQPGVWILGAPQDPVREGGLGIVIEYANQSRTPQWIAPKLAGWRNSETRPGERVKDVHLTEDTLAVDLFDGRTIIVPLVWYPRLLNATADRRSNWRISAAGYGLHWPDIDEDLSTAGLVRGAPAAAEPVSSHA